MSNLISLADREFGQRLETLEWPPEEFHHRLHVRLAYIFLGNKPQDTAFDAMRDWTFRYLAHHEIDRRLEWWCKR